VVGGFTLGAVGKSHSDGRGCPIATDINYLVDVEHGLISQRIFIEREIYEQELEPIFARCWLFLCHESPIPQAGDFLTT
jgi:hypothetical protein